MPRPPDAARTESPEERRERAWHLVLVWRPPQLGQLYVIGADVGEGLASGDASCAIVLERQSGDQVAELHGRIPPDPRAGGPSPPPRPSSATGRHSLGGASSPGAGDPSPQAQRLSVAPKAGCCGHWAAKSASDVEASSETLPGSRSARRAARLLLEVRLGRLDELRRHLLVAHERLRVLRLKLRDGPGHGRASVNVEHHV